MGNRYDDTRIKKLKLGDKRNIVINKIFLLFLKFTNIQSDPKIAKTINVPNQISKLIRIKSC